ncbi:tryptophan-tRNA ligase, variant 3 [Aphanomyces invadans]|uniref:Tryptophan--tRNA ligase, mitochondrial n=2 Tax=Aphanomyces invadans TaxID=157072 RepID=A0A024UHQ5_9STRA|nr:tryptophan-tRNA ligase, variant 3 [Aphanomyces invadans]XP_008865517.1 tryptophan-tRNA ligase, variant 2 [Aphanomyces invadans]ETW05739.1 tryptophan-tRNA ligase, variant 2 [Aphanomyces invadans]ETW05740.1 tryptophan-tRNA ligase, variant 3 [Aphanomyces invadans]|eukprot:XP_008865516.1 tryptophan-tRNA ligase, variant 3 [Aphanomyces invadans]
MTGARTAAAAKVVFSGIQPTGVPHLGNYCGAVSKWVSLQQQSHGGADADLSLYSIVDLHAITLPYKPSKLQANIHGLLASLLGCGLDPKKSILFKQSDVAQHTELAWLLSCITPLSWMQRMTQFKQKSQQKDSNAVSLGLLSYPALMAADVLLYKATHVPVGDDQQQHLELARMIATTFNDRFQTNLFPKPIPQRDDPNDALVRIMSLRVPTEKMSKSDASPMSRIDLTDSPDTIVKKIRKAQTDAIPGISYDKAARPGVSNLMSILSAVTGQSLEDIQTQYGTHQTGQFKQVVADAVVAKIGPIGHRIQTYQADPAYLNDLLRDGRDSAAAIAASTMVEVKAAMGL